MSAKYALYILVHQVTSASIFFFTLIKDQPYSQWRNHGSRYKAKSRESQMREVRDIRTKEKLEWSERLNGNLPQTCVCSLGNIQEELEHVRSQNCETARGTAHKTEVQWETRTKNDKQGKWGMSVPFMWRSNLGVQVFMWDGWQICWEHVSLDKRND